jgi:SAM-dependent methyltransferase
MPLDAAVTSLKAAADPSRIRLLALLAGGEATVGELVEVMEQSQPRVSRHLKILTAARFVSHFREGQSVYYRLDPSVPVGELAARVVALARAGDPGIASDEARMAGVRRRRERYAFNAPAGPGRWVELSRARPEERALAQALDDALGEAPLGDVLDIGAGSGALLRLLAPRARTAVGLDTSRPMRLLARSRLQEAGLGRCTIRAGDMHALPFADLAFDLVLLDEVLTLTARPERALAEALRVLRPNGRLLILDRVLPAALRLPEGGPRGALFENQLEVISRGLGARLQRPAWFPGRAPGYALVSVALAPPRTRTGTDE